MEISDIGYEIMDMEEIDNSFGYKIMDMGMDGGMEMFGFGYEIMDMGMEIIDND